MLPVRYIFWFLTWIQQTRNHGVFFFCVCVLFVSDLDTTDQLPWGLFVVAVLNTTDVYQMRYIFYCFDLDTTPVTSEVLFSFF